MFSKIPDLGDVWSTTCHVNYLYLRYRWEGQIHKSHPLGYFLHNLPCLIYIQLLTLTDRSLPLICRSEYQYIFTFSRLLCRGARIFFQRCILSCGMQVHHIYYLSDKSQPCIEKFSKTRSPPGKDITAENSAKALQAPRFRRIFSHW